jgi:hypothetical protein
MFNADAASPTFCEARPSLVIDCPNSAAIAWLAASTLALVNREPLASATRERLVAFILELRREIPRPDELDEYSEPIIIPPIMPYTRLEEIPYGVDDLRLLRMNRTSNSSLTLKPACAIQLLCTFILGFDDPILIVYKCLDSKQV